MKNSFVYLLMVSALFPSYQIMGQGNRLIGQLINEDTTITIRFSKKNVWSAKNELEVFDKYGMTKRKVKPFEYDEIYLDNSPIISATVGGQDMFLHAIVVTGQARLYSNLASTSKKIFYIKVSDGDIEEIDKNNVNGFLKDKMAGGDDRTDMKLDKMIMPERSMYQLHFFENIIYSYNAGREPKKYNDVDKRIKYKAYAGLVAGYLSKGTSWGFFVQMPFSRLMRFDLEMLYSHYKAPASLNFGNFSTGVFEASTKEVSLPVGLRFVPTPGKRQFSLQSGVMPRFSFYQFGENNLVGPQNTSDEEFNINPYFGVGFNSIGGFKKSFGIDARVIQRKHENLVQILFRVML